MTMQTYIMQNTVIFTTTRGKCVCLSWYLRYYTLSHNQCDEGNVQRVGWVCGRLLHAPLFLRRMVHWEGSLPGFSICMRNHKQLCISACQLWKTAVKYQLITLCSISGSCVFCLPGWGGVGRTQALGKYTPSVGKSLFLLGAKVNTDPAVGRRCDPLSTAPHVPRAHMGCTCTCHCPHVKNLQDNLQALGKIWSLPHLQGLNKEWPLV